LLSWYPKALKNQEKSNCIGVTNIAIKLLYTFILYHNILLVNNNLLKNDKLLLTFILYYAIFHIEEINVYHQEDMKSNEEEYADMVNEVFN